MSGRVSICATIVMATAVVSWSPASLDAGEVPSDRIIAIYFHRTERCPTCVKMGSYTEEAVKKGFAKELKTGDVAFHYVDFQARKNAALAKGYKVAEPALVVARIANGKVAEYKNLSEIWAKVADKPGFVKYVQAHIASYRPAKDRTVALYFHRTERCPTCQKMGGYSEEAIQTAFAPEIKKGSIGFYYVDFQAAKNSALVRRFNISGPALVVAQVKNHKVTGFTNLQDIWTKVADKEDFMDYVQSGIESYRIQDALSSRR